MTGFGKRKLERYNLNAPADLTITGNADISETGVSAHVMTKNISSEGAFLTTDRPFRIGTRVDIGLSLSFNVDNGELKKESCIRVKGQVIRVETDGMAVRFGKHYQISPIE